MIVTFIVIANEVLKCYGARFCEPMSAVELTRMWQVGLVEVMFEGTIGGIAMKVWRRIKDKFPSQDEIDSRQDKSV